MKKHEHDDERGRATRVTPLTFGCIFVLFPRLIGTFEAVVAHEAAEVNSKWLALHATIRLVTIGTNNGDYVALIKR